MDRRRVGIGVGTVALVVVAAGLGARWLSDDGDSARLAVPPVDVSRFGEPAPLQTFGGQDEAAGRASELAGFEVLPARHLPKGFSVTSFVLRPESQIPGAPQEVSLFVHSLSGGLIISQAAGRFELTDVPAIKGPPGGDFFRSEYDGVVNFYLLTEERTYAILPGAPDTLTQEQAVKILGGFLED